MAVTQQSEDVGEEHVCNMAVTQQSENVRAEHACNMVVTQQSEDVFAVDSLLHPVCGFQDLNSACQTCSADAIT